MNKIQKVILAIYLPITLLFLILDNLYPGENFVTYMKFATIISLFITGFCIKKKYHEQKIMSLSLLFIVIGDFFLVYCSTIPKLSEKVIPFGMLSFMFAYLTLIKTFQKNFKIGLGEILALIPVLAVFIPIFLKLYPYINGPIFYAVIVFSVVLCYMTWTSISTIFRGYYAPTIAKYIALSGFLMLICDIGVANSIFNPAFVTNNVPLLKNIIWSTYIPGWSLIVFISAEENLLCPYDKNSN